MITGHVNRRMEAIIPIALLDSNGALWRHEVVVDTGFNGDLTLPADFIRQLGFAEPGQLLAELADGQVIMCNYHHIIILWEGFRRSVEVMESETQSLLGTNLLRGRMLMMQMIDGGDVIIDDLTGQ